jgi:hypothetical protein
MDLITNNPTLEGFFIMALAQPTPIIAFISTENLKPENAPGYVGPTDFLTIPGPAGSFAVLNIYFDFSPSYVYSSNPDYLSTGYLLSNKFKKTLSLDRCNRGYENMLIPKTPDLTGVILEAGDILKIKKSSFPLGSDVTVSVNGLFYKAS